MAATYKYGIDFGTTNSSIALHYDEGNTGIRDNHVFDVDYNLISKELLPSVVYIDAMGDTAVGTKGRRKYGAEDIPKRMKYLSRKIKLLLDENKRDTLVVEFGTREYYISDIIALILKRLKTKADQFHTIKTDGFIFGVPVNYNEDCKRVMLEATVKAKFFADVNEAEEKVEFLSEPVAVALDYGLNLNDDKNVLVFDFGGGTLDLAIVRLRKSDTESDNHEVIAKHRITLGGELYTEQFFKKVFIRKYSRHKLLQAFTYDYSLSENELWEKLENDPLGQEFIDEIEKTKCELSYEEEVFFQWGGSDRERLVNISCELTRSEFEYAIKDSFDDIQIAIENCLSSAGLPKNAIDEVLMAGGSSLIPCIIEQLYNYFGKNIVRNPSKNALTSIVKGLAVKGYQEKGNEWVEDVVDSDYGIWIADIEEIEVIIKKNTKVSKTKISKENINQGTYRDCRALNDIPPVIKVYQGKDKIGEFTLPHRGSGRYRVFYEIDNKLGWLTVHIYDRRTMQWYDNVLEHNKIKI